MNEKINDAKLLRVPYHSLATDQDREFLVYLPVGYDSDSSQRWPVIIFLHGTGERGNGRADLDYILCHGPQAEAWIYRRNLPFVIVALQLPIFGMHEHVQLRNDVQKPVRDSNPPQRRVFERPDRPMARTADLSPTELSVTEAWGDDGPPGGWQLCEEDLMGSLEKVLSCYQTDPNRVYLTGLSYGGYGAWHLATEYPEKWAAVAPFCGDGNSARVGALAAAQTPFWIFHGGRDTLIKPHWAYDMANALESAGHNSVRLTIHEDLAHDCWTRMYGGQDLYDWFLNHERGS